MSRNSYNRHESSRYQRPTARTPLGHWVPLALTLTVATIGLATWIWSERRDDSGPDEYHDQGASTRYPKDSPARGLRKYSSIDEDHGDKSTEIIIGDNEEKEKEYDVEADVASEHTGEGQSSGLVARMSNAIRRTPSPQQLLNAASRGVSAAAIAVMGGRTSLVSDTGVVDPSTGAEFGHVEREGWGEEVEKRGILGGNFVESTVGNAGKREQQIGKAQTRGERKVVVIVVDSATTDMKQPRRGMVEDKQDKAYYPETSFLSNIPQPTDHDMTQILVMIHAPHLISQAFSMRPTVSDTRFLYDELFLAASQLVAHPTHILHFSSSIGHVSLLRHIGPWLVYLEDSLCGDGQESEHVKAIESWVGQIVIVATPITVPGQRDIVGKNITTIQGAKIKEDWTSRLGK